jgi:hypothetical protein
MYEEKNHQRTQVGEDRRGREGERVRVEEESRKRTEARGDQERLRESKRDERP